MPEDTPALWNNGINICGGRALNPTDVTTLTGERFIGIDAGTETIKIVELQRDRNGFSLGRREVITHRKQFAPALLEALQRFDWEGVAGAAVTGRYAGQINLPRIPKKQAQLRGYRFRFGTEPATIVDIGSHGFSVLELRSGGLAVFRENSRCSQGTGNFLCQLTERFSLTVEEASALCADVEHAAPLSGRCPVILKTDMTHLANTGEDRLRILAGLFDAVCENVLVLIRPGVSPARVLLTGGVSRSPRVRRVFGRALEAMGMSQVALGEEDSLCLEALGTALAAADTRKPRPELARLLLPPREVALERLPALRQWLADVHRMAPQPWANGDGTARSLVLGFDIGSTGSKLVALDAASHEVVWEGYRGTGGDPVGAAQRLLEQFAGSAPGKYPVVAFGVTGSGRDVVGSLLTALFGREAVFVVNEIVAHATGALHYDPRVDTIFEIGGQDAKYIRLEEGRIVDSAMNEACSAGTGSFIEEQGRKFAGMEEVTRLGEAAMAAPAGISLGQHCSVFMAEVIDEAVAAGVSEPEIISGLYDSIIKNYLNRVKGNRSVGRVIFCQGMPFSADALSAAVARHTGSTVIVPPNPGTVGALGIALLAERELGARSLRPLDTGTFLEASVECKDTFVCNAHRGCGTPGNLCRIERIRTLLKSRRSTFTWGGGCALHDTGTRKKKLPDLAPDPFRERRELMRALIEPFTVRRGRPRIAMSEEFMLKGWFAFFAAFFSEAGYDLEIAPVPGQETLKSGIQSADVPFCAPMQLYHGVAQAMFKTGAEAVFIPMVRKLPGVEGQRSSVACPVVQASPDVLRWSLAHGNGHRRPRAGTDAGRQPRILSPLLDLDAMHADPGSFLKGIAAELGLDSGIYRKALATAGAVQKEFERGCLSLGERALAYCREQHVVPVIVLGRAYTIYNTVLNSNVPAILREQGAIGIPVDCYPVQAAMPVFADMYWGYGQNILRAAHQVRRTPGEYALYCSNYSCGPDSFTLHFAAYVMEGKPFAVIETDGHSGDAGTKTRVEAFLHCVDEDRRAGGGRAAANDFRNAQFSGLRLGDLGHNGSRERLLIPYVGPASDVPVAVLRGLGLVVEGLPPPDWESLQRGRRYTSGKECLPMPLTLGSLLQRLDRAKENERFVYLMTSTDGPCRQGVYNLLTQIVLERLGWRDRVRIWSPKDTGYFDDFPIGTEMLVLTGFAASELLLQAKLDVRPAERVPGGADRLFDRYHRELLSRLETAGRGDLSRNPALWEVLSGRLFGIRRMLEKAGEEFAAMRAPADLPLVELTGEIYVRAVDFSNGSLIEQLEARGLRVYLAPKLEWLDYCRYLRVRAGQRNGLGGRLSDAVRHRIEEVTMRALGRRLGWPPPPTAEETLSASRPYVSDWLEGEAVLTIGAPLHKWRRGLIDAVVSVGPLECMPTKIAEAQFHHVAEHEGLPSLTIAFNGEPVSTAALDNFAYEVHARRCRRKKSAEIS